MTIPYNSVWYSCYCKFVDSLKKDGVDYKNLNEENKKVLRKVHKEFYIKLKTQLKDEFYQNKDFEMIDFKYVKRIAINKSEYKINYRTRRDKYDSS